MLKKLFYIFCIILGLIGIAATIIVIPVSASILVGTVLPGIAGVIVLGFGLMHLIKPGYIFKNRILRIIVTVCVCIAIASFVFIEALIIVSANTDAEDSPVNYVVVLGAGVFPDGRLTLTLIKRLDGAYDYLMEHEDVLCIVSGGQGENEPLPEGVAMKAYLVEKGIGADRIIAETNSFSTKNNMVLSAKIMDEMYPHVPKTAAIVTSDFHLFRSKILARDSGIDAVGIPCETPWYVRINCYMRECLAVINTWLFQMG